RDLVGKIYTGGLQPFAIAALAIEVQNAAEAGDEVAQRIIDQGARELTTAALSVARRLDLDRAVVVLAGGILRGLSAMRASVTRQRESALPGVVIRPLEDQPAVGAVRLALRFAAGSFEPPRYVDDH